MNREKMIEAITTAILGKTAPKAAAAVLDLCGPKPLAFNSNGSVRVCRSIYVVLESDYDDGASEIWYVMLNGKTLSALGEYKTEAEAQAAAQAHAYAAHWANTVIGASQ